MKKSENQLPAKLNAQFPAKIVSGIIEKVNEQGIENLSDREVLVLCTFSLNQSVNNLRQSIKGFQSVLIALLVTIWSIVIFLILNLIFKF